MAGQIIKRSDHWLIRVFQGNKTDPDTGKVRRDYANRTIHGSKRDAQAVLNEMLREQDLGATVNSKLTVDALLNSLLLDYKVNRPKRYRWGELIMRLHLRPAFGNLRIPQVTTDAIQKYTADRLDAGAEPGTINRELAVLKRGFMFGMKCTPPKVGRLPYIPMLKEDNVRKGFLEHDAFLGIRGAMPEFWARVAVSFAYYTAVRRGELLAFEWTRVDLAEKVAILEPPLGARAPGHAAHGEGNS
jgi:integrase